MAYQRQLLNHLELIQQIVRQTARRRHFSPDEEEDFAGFVYVRLLDDESAILRKFKHRSTIETYLTAVIAVLASDFRNDLWGRWRVSAVATRLGPAAELLERLVYHDRHALEDAIALVRSRHGVALTEAELRVVWAMLPVRQRPFEVHEVAAHVVPAPDEADVHIEDEERRKDIERVESALRTALAAMPSRDRLALALRFDHGLTVAEIARLQGKSAATVYRRMDRRIRDLRSALAQAGVDGRLAMRLIGHPYIGLSPMLRSEIENFFGSVRLSKRDE